MKKIALAAMLYLFVSSAFASCAPAEPISSKNFCSTFEAAAKCNCFTKAPPASCVSMQRIIELMMIYYKTLEKVCQAQHQTTFENCMTNWNCYLYGTGTGNQTCNTECTRSGA